MSVSYSFVDNSKFSVLQGKGLKGNSTIFCFVLKNCFLNFILLTLYGRLLFLNKIEKWAKYKLTASLEMIFLFMTVEERHKKSEVIFYMQYILICKNVWMCKVSVRD